MADILPYLLSLRIVFLPLLHHFYPANGWSRNDYGLRSNSPWFLKCAKFIETPSAVGTGSERAPPTETTSGGSTRASRSAWSRALAANASPSAAAAHRPAACHHLFTNLAISHPFRFKPLSHGPLARHRHMLLHISRNEPLNSQHRNYSITKTLNLIHFNGIKIIRTFIF